MRENARESERLNVVWFLIDSIRAYRTDGDLRGKLPVMEKFGRQSVEFTTCVTTAPSTVMSVTAMMTGLPAYFLARNYDDFRFDSQRYHSLSNLMKQQGYASYAFLRGPQTREKFRNLVDMVPRAYWPRGLKHGSKWRNEALNALLENVLEAGIHQPAFLFFHYNPHTRSEKGELLIDPLVSDKVEEAWSRLEEAGFTAQNSVYVMCSDHGFPDPSTGMTSEWEAKHRLTHDLVLTDDNILIPLYFRYPGCKPQKRVDTPVSSLDIFATVLDLADFPGRDRIISETDGHSLLPLMNGNEEAEAYPREYFRSDSRLLLQTGRSTAIRGRDFKYIRFHDEFGIGVASTEPSSSEVLIDLRKDPSEEKNLLTSRPADPRNRELLEKFRREFERTEKRAVEFQLDYFLARQRKGALANLRDRERVRRTLLMFAPDTAGYEDIALRALAHVNSEMKVDVLTSRESQHEADEGVSPRARRFLYGQEASGRLSFSNLPTHYDLVILFVQNATAPIISKLLKVARSVTSRREFVLDCNFNVYRRRRYWYYRLRALAQTVPYLVEEPSLVLSHARLGARLIARRILTKLGLWERWGSGRIVTSDEE